MAEGQTGGKDNAIIKSSDILTADKQLKLPDQQPPVRQVLHQNHEELLLSEKRRILIEPKIYNFDLPHLDFLLRRNQPEDLNYVYDYTGALLKKVPRPNIDQQPESLTETKQQTLQQSLAQIESVISHYYNIAGDLLPAEKAKILDVFKENQDLFDLGVQDPNISKQLIKIMARLRLEYPMQFGDESGYKTFLIEFIQRNLSGFQHAVNTEDPELVYEAMEIVSSVLHGGQYKWAADFLVSNFETAYRKSYSEDYGKILRIITNQDEHSISNVQILVRHMLAGNYPLNNLIKGFSSSVQNAISLAADRKTFHMHQLNLLYRMYEPQLKKHGLDPQIIFSAWRKADELGMNCNKNIATIEELEQKHPGVCQRLYTTFGITCFGRYPNELLITQDYQARNHPTGANGLIIFPTDDNPSPAYYQDVGLLQKLYHSIDDFGIIPFVFESHSQLDLTKKLLRFGQLTKTAASFVLMGGHGSDIGDLFLSYSIDATQKSHKITIEDIKRQVVQTVIGKILRPNAPVIFHSCFAGKENGLGQQVSLLGYPVTGPNTEAHLSNISPYFDNGRLNFVIDYGSAKSIYYENGEKVSPYKLKIRSIKRALRSKLSKISRPS